MLISESGIDWGSDEELVNILLSCGTESLDSKVYDDITDVLT